MARLPVGQQASLQDCNEAGQPFLFPDVYGAAHRSNATAFAFLGTFVLRLIFGPLEILYAGRAEAHGAPATPGKVSG